MSVKERRRIGSFTAKDARGKNHTIYVYQDIIDVGTLTDPHAESGGMKSLKTASGDHVNSLGGGKYLIVALGIQLTSDDPNRVE